jgi:hypothetical protein
MANKFSLHVGLNKVDPTKYLGQYKTLKNAENDAVYYESLARANQYSPTMLLGIDANSELFLGNLKSFAQRMVGGDQLFISYSGHGTRVPDLNTEETEEDEKDEAMVLYDRLVIDDELKALWPLFHEDVKIFLINDSCNNGTLTRYMFECLEPVDVAGESVVLRGIDEETSAPDFERLRDFYQNVSIDVPNASCSIIQMASSQDNQYSDDGFGVNGDFTSRIKVICDAGFSGSYRQLYDQVYADMPRWQKPNWDTLAGKPDPDYENSPFLN